MCSNMKDDSQPRENYHHGNLPEALISKGAELLAEKGPEKFSMREVARRAGVAVAAPAHHFGNAKGLLTAIATVDLGYDPWNDSLVPDKRTRGRRPHHIRRQSNLDRAIVNDFKINSIMAGKAAKAHFESTKLWDVGATNSLRTTV